MKHICFIIHLYATPVTPFTASFIRALAWSMRDKGYRISIISPLPVNLNREFMKVPYKVEEKTLQGNAVPVYYPKTIQFGQTKKLFGMSLVHLTTYAMEKAADRVLRSFPEKPDVLYGHFLAPSGIVCARLGRKYNIPAFFACGESHDTIGQFGADKARKECESLKGVIAVSSACKNYLLADNIVPADKIVVYPNGYESSKFAEIDKLEARRTLGWNENDVVICFVGAFKERKGILRLCKAMENVKNAKFVCIGGGDQQPYGENLIFAKRMLSTEIPTVLYASDIFVLPTLLEGCSNAIVEAIACGLPVISSDLPFNDELLEDSNSIRIDPMSVDQIRDSIQKLVDNKDLREKLSEAAKKKREELTLDERTNKILNFIETHI